MSSRGRSKYNNATRIPRTGAGTGVYCTGAASTVGGGRWTGLAVIVDYCRGASIHSSFPGRQTEGLVALHLPYCSSNTYLAAPSATLLPCPAPHLSSGQRRIRLTDWPIAPLPLTSVSHFKLRVREPFRLQRRSRVRLPPVCCDKYYSTTLRRLRWLQSLGRGSRGSVG